MTADLGAYLMGVLMGLLIAGIAVVVWLSARIDDAATLPDPRSPHRLALADDDTTRIDPSNLADLPRRTRQEWTA